MGKLDFHRACRSSEQVPCRSLRLSERGGPNREGYGRDGLKDSLMRSHSLIDASWMNAR
jgi:hypothetical protein